MGSSVHLLILLEKVVEGFLFVCFIFTRKWIKYFHLIKLFYDEISSPPQEKGGQKASDFKKPGALLQNVMVGLTAEETGGQVPGTEHRTSATWWERTELEGRDRAEHRNLKIKETLGQRH